MLEHFNKEIRNQFLCFFTLPPNLPPLLPSISSFPTSPLFTRLTSCFPPLFSDYNWKHPFSWTFRALSHTLFSLYEKSPCVCTPLARFIWTGWTHQLLLGVTQNKLLMRIGVLLPNQLYCGLFAVRAKFNPNLIQLQEVNQALCCMFPGPKVSISLWFVRHKAPRDTLTPALFNWPIPPPAPQMQTSQF